MRRSSILWLDLGLKIALVGLLAYAVLGRDLHQFEGKAMGARTVAYSVSALIVPIGWWLAPRGGGRRIAYPYLLDILLVSPFLIDVVANTADLYDSIGWWDDANHFVNWALLVGAFGQLLRRLPVARWNAVALAVGFGAVTAILWELLEYVTFIHDSSESSTAYADTLGDLALGLSGSVFAAGLTLAAFWRRGDGGSISVPR